MTAFMSLQQRLFGRTSGILSSGNCFVATNKLAASFFIKRGLSSSLIHLTTPAPAHDEHFEVERKFRYDPAKVPLLEQNKGERRFESVRFLRERHFTDVYYDDHVNDYSLTTQDVWLRRREGAWECKVPTGLATSMDSYREVTLPAEIADLLGNVLPPVEGESRLTRFVTPSSHADFERYLHARHGLSPFCTISTVRRSYLLDGELTLDLDAADFGHHVGELELVVRLKEEVAAAERKIARFCLEHPWFFDVGDEARPVIGKLSAYISRFNARQWECMGRSAVLRRKIENESRGVGAAAGKEG
ncbi:CYTH-like domain-containing protein [Jimgerdemannia flammicorona]|uniref:CYTH-like domain-containing protein n=1 Tax=Jimgerdemannia flammicorona TaxID=994334 RepID=A0A433Q6F9_9FUNG|nr:CYTH-like domain-containing protein [Jimgerdemannia flammicorona]